MAQTPTKTRTSTGSRSTSNDPLRILKADHREVEKLLDRLAESDEGTEREQMIDELQTKLSLHMQLEEQLVYPLISEHVGGEDEEEASIEHGLAREGLDKVIAMSSMPGFGAAVEMLKGGIKHHVEEEEKELMPSLRDALERDEWRGLGDDIAGAKEAAGQPIPAPPKRRSAQRTKKPKN